MKPLLADGHQTTVQFLLEIAHRVMGVAEHRCNSCNDATFVTNREAWLQSYISYIRNSSLNRFPVGRPIGPRSWTRQPLRNDSPRRYRLTFFSPRTGSQLRPLTRRWRFPRFAFPTREFSRR